MPTWATILRLVLSALGTIFGISSFVFFYYGNYRAAVWALMSGLLAAVDFHLLFLSWRGTLASWHSSSTMKDFEVLAVLGLLGGVGFSIWYIFTFIYYNLNIFPVQDSYQIASVWAFMTAKWGLGLLLTSRHLGRQLTSAPVTSPSQIRNPRYYERLLA